MQFVLSGLLQATVAISVAFILYCGHALIAALRGRDRQHWSRWSGLHLPSEPGSAVGYFLAFFVVGCGFAFATRFLVPDYLEMARQTPQHQIAALPVGVMLLAAPIYAFVTTGFSEELLFRGVLAKRLIDWLGYGPGNGLQALLFGLLHVVLVRVGAPASGVLTYLLIGGFVTTMAWVAGWAMEKRGDGSILFPWMMHAGANLATVFVYVVAPVA